MFKFKLAAVLSLKEKVEDSKKRELGLVMVRKDQIQNEKCLLETEKKKATKTLKEQNEETLNIASFKAYYHYNKRMEQAIKAKEEELQVAQQKVEEKRNELLEAVKERKILENLKTIEKEVFDEEAKREEQRILDDLVTYKYGIKGKE